MDPNGETRVDTDSNADEVVNTTTDVQEDQDSKELNVLSPAQKDAESSTQQAQPVEETAQTLPSSQPDQESSANNAPEEKDDDHNDKETGKEKEKEKESQPPQSKQWKNPRKKKNKDEPIRDAAQWPTPGEARHGRGPPKKNHGEPGRNPSKSEREKKSVKKAINWKPLSADISKSQGTAEQSSSSIGGSPSASSAVGTEGERVGTTQGSGPASSTAGSGRGYQGSYGRGQPKRRGGRGPWPRSHGGGAQQFSQEGTSIPSENVAPETEGKDNAQVSQNIQDSGASSPPQAGQTYAPQESRRSYRGSVRGSSSRPSNRYNRGGGGAGGYSRSSYFNRYNPPRGGQPLAPLTVSQDPEQFREQVKKQIEYYFGVDNLCKDIFLRKNMNTEGWISIHLILNFNRVRELNIDLQGFVDALKDSTVVEIKDEFVRRRDDWPRWTFPPRVEGASQQKSQTQEDSTITEPISQ